MCRQPNEACLPPAQFWKLPLYCHVSPPACLPPSLSAIGLRAQSPFGSLPDPVHLLLLALNFSRQSPSQTPHAASAGTCPVLLWPFLQKLPATNALLPLVPFLPWGQFYLPGYHSGRLYCPLPRFHLHPSSSNQTHLHWECL